MSNIRDMLLLADHVPILPKLRIYFDVVIKKSRIDLLNMGKILCGETKWARIMSYVLFDPHRNEKE